MIVRKPAQKAEFRAEKMGKTDLVRAEHMFAGLNSFEPGQGHEPHVHCERDKIYVVLDGTGEVTVGEERSRIETGDMALAPANVEHSMRNPGPGRLVVLVVMSPPPRG